MGIDLLIFNSGEIRLRIRKTKHSITQRDIWEKLNFYYSIQVFVMFMYIPHI